MHTTIESLVQHEQRMLEKERLLQARIEYLEAIITVQESAINNLQERVREGNRKCKQHQ